MAIPFVEIQDKGEKIPTRFGFGDGLVEAGEKYPNVVTLGGDITGSVKTDLFRDAYPDRFYSIGIAEQNMMGIAAGLALSGKIPFSSTYGVFASGRAWDQLRTTVCYTNLHVVIGGAHGGISVGPDGATHQALEEMTITRCLPNITVFNPCDYWETKKSTLAACEIDGPVYIRFGREKVPVITAEDTPFETGKGILFHEGADCAIIATGVMATEGYHAALDLAKEGINCAVLNIHTVKPIDTAAIVEVAEKCGCVVTAEEHQVYGGFGSAVMEQLAWNHPVPVESVAVMDRFGESGDPDELMAEFGLTKADIINAVRKVLERKK